jgi:hypothetical protein
MSWYSKQDNRECFTYPKDWGGFNIPASIIADVHKLGIKDLNGYDKEMLRIYKKIIKKSPKFYLIGTCGNDALDHEVAHGLFYVNGRYKKAMSALVKAIKPRAKKAMIKYLTDLGYAKHVHIDECQAYLATGINLLGIDANTAKPFIELFNHYNGI